jgi:hypothetical protein
MKKLLETIIGEIEFFFFWLWLICNDTKKGGAKNERN